MWAHWVFLWRNQLNNGMYPWGIPFTVYLPCTISISSTWMRNIVPSQSGTWGKLKTRYFALSDRLWINKTSAYLRMNFFVAILIRWWKFLNGMRLLRQCLDFSTISQLWQAILSESLISEVTVVFVVLFDRF